MNAPYDVILSGPITGTTDHKERFRQAHEQVSASFESVFGYTPNVWNPALLPDGNTNEWYMRRCHDAIFDSPRAVLVQMDGWENSKGSRSEHALCVSLGRGIWKV